MNTKTAAAIVTSLLLPLAACGSGPASSPQATFTASAAAASSRTLSPSPSRTPSATSSGEGTHRVGQSAVFSVTTTTVLQVKPLGHIQGRSRYAWGVLARTCMHGGKETYSLWWNPWYVVDSSDGVYAASSEQYSSDPVPTYPDDPNQIIPNGTCAKGWIVFETGTGVVITSARYSNSSGDVATWRR